MKWIARNGLGANARDTMYVFHVAIHRKRLSCLINYKSLSLYDESDLNEDFSGCKYRIPNIATTDEEREHKCYTHGP